jgi:hypothetical protein
MKRPQIVSRAEWQTAHEALLAKEKAATRARDALAAERRRQPMVRIEKDYVFECPQGKSNLARPVRWPSPVDLLSLHVRTRRARLARCGLSGVFDVRRQSRPSGAFAAIRVKAQVWFAVPDQSSRSPK